MVHLENNFETVGQWIHMFWARVKNDLLLVCLNFSFFVSDKGRLKINFAILSQREQFASICLFSKLIPDMFRLFSGIFNVEKIPQCGWVVLLR